APTSCSRRAASAPVAARSNPSETFCGTKFHFEKIAVGTPPAPTYNRLSLHHERSSSEGAEGEGVTTSDREVVAALQQGIAERIGTPRYPLWFDRNTKFTWADDLLTVGVPNHFYQEWLQTTFADAVRAAAAEALERPMQVRFVIDPELFRAARKEQEAG